MHKENMPANLDPKLTLDLIDTRSPDFCFFFRFKSGEDAMFVLSGKVDEENK